MSDIAVTGPTSTSDSNDSAALRQLLAGVRIPTWIAAGVMAAAAVTAAAIDYACQRLPDALTYPIAVAGGAVFAGLQINHRRSRRLDPCRWPGLRRWNVDHRPDPAEVISARRRQARRRSRCLGRWPGRLGRDLSPGSTPAHPAATSCSWLPRSAWLPSKHHTPPWTGRTLTVVPDSAAAPAKRSRVDDRRPAILQAVKQARIEVRDYDDLDPATSSRSAAVEALTLAAACYLLPEVMRETGASEVPNLWAWPTKAWIHHDDRAAELMTGVALALAAIELVDADTAGQPRPLAVIAGGAGNSPKTCAAID